MSSDYSIFLVLAPFMGVVVLIATILAWNRRAKPGSRFVPYFAFTSLCYLVFNTLELASRSRYWTLFWAKSEHVGAAFLAIFWLLFVFDFTSHARWIRPKFFWPFVVIPATDVILTYTNRYHHLVWTHEFFFPVGRSLGLIVGHGPWFFVSMIVDFLMLLGGLVVIQREFYAGRGLYRRQLLWITFGIVIPILFSVVYTFHLIPSLHKDYTPLGFAIGAMMFIVAMHGSRFLEISPPSRTRIFDALSDGVVVLDANHRIVDMNRRAMVFLDLPESVLGNGIASNPHIVPLLEQYAEGIDEVQVDVFVGDGLARRYYELKLTRLTAARDGRNGSLLLVHDITERVGLMDEIKTLRGIVPICARCKKIRDDQGFWRHVEAYVSEHSYAEFSHGLCPACLEELYPEKLKRED